MKWNSLRSLEQIDQLKTESKQAPVLIFKHSSRCNISRTTLDRLERNWQEEELPDVRLYFLDLLTYRNISDTIAEEFQVDHESPQVVIIRHEKATYDESHFGIDYGRIRDVIKS